MVQECRNLIEGSACACAVQGQVAGSVASHKKLFHCSFSIRIIATIYRNRSKICSFFISSESFNEYETYADNDNFIFHYF